MGLDGEHCKRDNIQDWHVYGSSGVNERLDVAGPGDASYVQGLQPPAQICDTAHFPDDWSLINLADGEWSVQAQSMLYHRGKPYANYLFWPRAAPVSCPDSMGVHSVDVGAQLVSCPGRIEGLVEFYTENDALDGLKDLLFQPYGPAAVDFSTIYSGVRSEGTTSPEGSGGIAVTRYDIDPVTPGAVCTHPYPPTCFDPDTGRFMGRYEQLVSGLYSGRDRTPQFTWPWKTNLLTAHIDTPISAALRAATMPLFAEHPTTGILDRTINHCGLTITDLTHPSRDVPLGDGLIEPPACSDSRLWEPFSYCFGRVIVEFHSPNDKFKEPRLTSVANGRGPTSASPEYEVNVSATGFPDRDEPADHYQQHSQVVMYLPEAENYRFRADATSATGPQRFDGIGCDIDVRCGQDVRIDGGLNLGVAVDDCTPAGTATMTAETSACDADGTADVVEVTSVTNGGPPVVECPDLQPCSSPLSMSFSGLQECDNTITIRALDAIGNSAEVISHVRYDTVAPSLAGVCPGDLTAQVPQGGSAPFPALDWTDNCACVLTETYTYVDGHAYPAGTEIPPRTQLPVGTHRIQSTVTDCCGNASECTVDFIVTSNRPPLCDAGGPYVVDCTESAAPLHLDGSGSSDPDGDATSHAWTTDCPGHSLEGLGEFDNGASPTPNLTLLGSLPPCPQRCKVYLTVKDHPSEASASCEATVTVEDVTPPDVTPPPDLHQCPGASISDPDVQNWLASATSVDGCFGELPTPGNDAASHDPLPNACAPVSVPIEFTSMDACGNTGSGVGLIHVGDTQGPVIDRQPDLLPRPGLPCVPLPGDNRNKVNNFVTFTISDTLIAAHDACGGRPTFRYSYCASSQSWTGNGDITQPDCIISDDGQRVSLRAEYAPNCRKRRLYTLKIEAVDACDRVTPSDPFTVCVDPTRRSGGRKYPCEANGAQPPGTPGTPGPVDCSQQTGCLLTSSQGDPPTEVWGPEDELDPDGDGVVGAQDNCFWKANPNQANHGGDQELGDACDPDDGLITGLEFDFASTTAFAWEEEADSSHYDVYRGGLVGAGLLPAAACLARVTVSEASDAAAPVAEAGFFYLVSSTRAGQEGSLGYASDGTERPAGLPCP